MTKRKRKRALAEERRRKFWERVAAVPGAVRSAFVVRGGPTAPKLDFDFNGPEVFFTPTDDAETMVERVEKAKAWADEADTSPPSKELH